MKKDELKKHLHECLRREVMMSDKPFSWARTIHKAIKCPDRRFNFWWRIVSFLHKHDSTLLKKLAHRINRKLIQKYHTEIHPGTQIGSGLTVSHFLSVVINECAVIGCNFKIRQNSTIGISGRPVSATPAHIIIGDNVEVGAGTCIIGDALIIGNNVTIGAMSFINKNIPDNSVVFTEKSLIIRVR